MMVTSAAATVLATTLLEMLDMLPPLDELRHDSRNSTSDCTNGSDNRNELRLRHIRTAPHRLTLLQLQKVRLDAIQRSEDPVDLSITHHATSTVNDAAGTTTPQRTELEHLPSCSPAK
jgi:hypothetical protein